MFGFCEEAPLWYRDDVDACFQAYYLQTVYPIVACTLSLSLVVVQALRRIIKSKKQHIREHELLLDIEEETSDDDDSLANLTLQRTVSRTYISVHDINKPRGEVILVVVELFALFGQLSLSVLSLFTNEIPVFVSVASTITWAYITILATARLFIPSSRCQVSYMKVWRHSSFLYGAQWIFEVMVFRSSVIHREGVEQWIFPTIHFSLTSLLFSIALVSRKGSKAVALEYEGDIEPSREPLASVFSLATFSWADAIIWKGYKNTLEITDVWNITIKDKAATVLANFRQVKRTHGLALRLFKFFKKRLLIQGVWSVLGSVTMFFPTLLLKAILEYLEDQESTPKNAAWLYVFLLLASGIINAVADGQAFWEGKRVGIRLRAIIVGELYSKTLRRKAAASIEKKLSKGDGEDTEPKPLSKRLVLLSKRVMFFGRKIKEDSQLKESKMVETQVNNGTIINLMSIDSFKIAETCAYLHFLWACAPVQLAMATTLLYTILGFSSFVGIGLMVLILPMNFFIAKSFQTAQKKIMAATDVRIHATSEVLQNIRIIKYFAWEQRFFDGVNDKRRTELRALRWKYILWSLAATIWNGVPILITFMSFLAYTIFEKKPLTPSIAFPSLSMFSLLRIPLNQLADMVAHVQESKVSVDRVEEFLKEEETEKYVQLRDAQPNTGEGQISFKDATLTWGAKPASTEDADTTEPAFQLINVNVEFAIGALNIIVGPTGSGKTSLLMALLGEMKLIKGNVFIPGGSVRQDLRPDNTTGLTESVAFCAQQAWLFNDTIKENILFASPYDQGRYKTVLSVCALERDLQILDDGDQTLVGEKGIALSGGQKQRISLARAMYCNSKHILLDDCLSAVDSHTAKHIFESAIVGPLMANRTCILVTHNATLTVPRANFVVLLENGKVKAQGDPEALIKSGCLGELLKYQRQSKENSVAPSRIGSNLEDVAKGHSHANGGLNGEVRDLPDKRAALDTRIEAKAIGRVKLETIKVYLRALGSWYFWIFATVAFLATQLGSVATNVWVSRWASAYGTSNVDLRHTAVNTIHHPTKIGMSSLQHNSFISMPQNFLLQPKIFSLNTLDVDVGYYLGVYAVLGLTYVSICFFRELLFFLASLQASWTFHERLLKNVMRAKLQFFDSTPLGQLMNRFSKDVQAIDQEVAPTVLGMIHYFFSIVTIVILISVITPGFLVAGVFISGVYVATGFFYIHSARDLKRIEAVQRSPLFQHFGETLSGIVTIRAYGDESRFILDSYKKVNTHNRPVLYLSAVNRWLTFRINVVGSLVAFFSGIFIILSAGRIDAGAAGLALSYAISFTENLLWLVRLYTANEQNMNAVERVLEYVRVDQEAKSRIPETKPASGWPSHGVIEFFGYSTTYRTDLEPVLKDLSFKINAAEKVGIIGRTGAGKSSLALALFRGLEATAGKILIDDVDISLIGLQDLREAITIVPQDPTLFTGTLRSNLDPFGAFADEDIFTALRRVQLISNTAPTPFDRTGASAPDDTGKTDSSTLASTPAKRSPNNSVDHSDGTTSSGSPLMRHMTNSVENKNIFYDLSSPVAESGSNLSQGQRQLLCLARALLKAPKVLIMDEATASVDYATDAKIQNTLRELQNNTIITIAHRLRTIVDYEKVLVLDKGEVVEYADPWELLRKEGGTFRGMCETSGDFDTLMELARKAWEGRRLVDDEE